MALDETILEKLNTACGAARVVFWEDSASEFSDDVADLEIDGVVVAVVEGNEVSLKRRVLRDEPDAHFLLYRAGGAPDIAADFLLDVKMLARPFSTTQSSSWAEELGLGPTSLPVVEGHAEFFKAKDRRQALKEAIAEGSLFEEGSYDEGLELAMVAACCGVKPGKRMDVVRGIAAKLVDQSALGRDDAERTIARCALDEVLWKTIGDTYAYHTGRPGAEDFSFEVVLSACADLTGQAGGLNSEADLLLSSMASDSRRRAAFDALLEKTAGYVESKCDFDAIGTDVLASHRYLPVVDSVIIKRVGAEAVQGLYCAEELASLKAKRVDSPSFPAWEPAYRALAAASALLSGASQFEAEIGSFQKAKDIYEAYVSRWHVLDRTYRDFRLRYQQAAEKAPNLFSKLDGKAEVAYTHFLDDLAVAWQQAVCIAHVWAPKDIDELQSEFFAKKVRRALVTGPVAVIISDALRFEAGVAWAERMRLKGGLQVEAGSMLSSLPSYTQLGMASLLPHGELGIDPGTHAATIDDKSATGTVNRGKILSSTIAGSVAMNDEKAFTQEGSKELGDATLAYIYHNEIDHMGDDRDSEQKVFTAVESTFGRLDSLCSLLFKRGFDTVFVTADHGFLYQQDKDKFEYADIDMLGAITHGEDAKSSRRYVVAPQLPEIASLVEFSAVELGLAGELQVGIPKGTRRLRLQGSGSRFVHGGMTLQETVVPCITLTKPKASGNGAGRPVAVEILTGGTKVISGSTLAFELFQGEPVGDGLTATRVRVALYPQGGDVPVSDVRTLEISSRSESAADRHVPVTLNVATDVRNGAVLELRVERRIGKTSKFETVDSREYKVRRNFGMDF